MPSIVTVGVLFALPLAIWLVFLVVVVRVLLAGALEDSLGYLVILRRRRNEFVALLAVLALSQIVKDTVQILWGISEIGQSVTSLVALGFNIISAAAVFSLAWLLLRPKTVTPKEDRLLSTMAESLYAIGKPEDFVRRPPGGST